MPGRNKHGKGWSGGAFVFIAAFVLVLDQVSKLWVRSNFAYGQSLRLNDFLSLTHVRNTGTAFGLFADQGFLLSLVAIVGLVAVLLFYRNISRVSSLGTVALGLVFGGAAGNLTDRLLMGYVTDFIDVRLYGDFHWPAFNVADSAITLGAICLACFILLELQKGGTSSLSNHTLR